MLHLHQSSVNNGLVGDVCAVKALEQPFVRRPFRVAQECREFLGGHAEQFQTWVCEEVLPSIRKTGGYGG